VTGTKSAVKGTGDTLTAGTVTGAAGETVSVPLILDLSSGANITTLSFNLTVSPVAGEAPVGTVTYVPAAGLPAPNINDNTTSEGSALVGWFVHMSPALSGTVDLGTLEVTIPSGASGGDAWTVQVVNPSGTDQGTPEALTGVNGSVSVPSAPVEDNTLTAGSVTDAPGVIVAVPLTLELQSGVEATTLSLNLTVSPVGGEAPVGTVTYVPAAGLPAPNINDNTTSEGSALVGWFVHMSPALSGTVDLGVLQVTIPVGASDGHQWTVEVVNPSGTNQGTPVTLVGVNGSVTADVGSNLLAVRPASLDFGTVLVGSSRVLPIELENVGGVDVTVSDVGMGTAQFAAAPLPGGALVLAPGQTAQVDITFSPDSVQSYADSVVVDGTASNCPVTVPASGEGVDRRLRFPVQPDAEAVVEEGGTAVIPLYLEQTGSCQSVQGVFDYDPAVVTVTDVTTTAFTSGGTLWADWTTTPGQVSFWLTSVPVVTGSGQLLAVSVSAAGAAPDTSVLDLHDCSVDEGAVGEIDGEVLLKRNTAPEATNDPYTTDEDTPLTVVAPGVLGNDNDVDGDPLTVSGFDATGVLGLVNIDADGRLTYDPNGQFESLGVGDSATETLTYTVSDGNGGSDTATVTITVTGVNDAPEATNDPYTTDEDTPLTIAAPGVLGNDNDVDGGALSVSGFDATGVLGLVNIDADGRLTYDPNGQFESLGVGDSATETLTYTVSDGNGGSDTATVTITVTGVAEISVVVNVGYYRDDLGGDPPGNGTEPGSDVISGVQLRLTSASAGYDQMATTDGAGQCTFADAPEAVDYELTIVADPAYDATRVDLRDVGLMPLPFFGLDPTWTTSQSIAGDVTENGIVSAFDSVYIQMRILGVLTSWPNGLPDWRYLFGGSVVDRRAPVAGITVSDPDGDGTCPLELTGIQLGDVSGTLVP